jgi:hypothetical protein
MVPFRFVSQTRARAGDELQRHEVDFHGRFRRRGSQP